MLTDVRWLTPEQAADAIWSKNPDPMPREEFVANWERFCPERVREGIYRASNVASWLQGGFCPSHRLVCEYPGDPTYGTAGEDIQDALRELTAEIQAGTWRSPYGTADDEDQVVAYLARFVDDPDRQYIIEVCWLSKERNGDFRFHKNGPYIGQRANRDDDGEEWMPEHLRDCDRLDGVVQFHIHEVAPALRVVDGG